MAECGVEKADGCFVKQACYILDSFRGNVTERLKANEDSNLVAIPSGMTKLLQPLEDNHEA